MKCFIEIWIIFPIFHIFVHFADHAIKASNKYEYEGQSIQELTAKHKLYKSVGCKLSTDINFSERPIRRRNWQKFT